MNRKEEILKGCGKMFIWIDYLKDERRCGQIEDLKHSEHIILCPTCQARLDERTRAEQDFLKILIAEKNLCSKDCCKNRIDIIKSTIQKETKE